MRGKLSMALTLAAVLAGCGGSTTTPTVTSTVTTATTLTGVTTVTIARKPAPPDKTVTQTVTHTVARTVTAAPVATGSYSGQGTKNVGTINVSQPSTLQWTCSGDCSTFAIGNNPNDQNSITLQASNQSSGNTAVDPGAYHDVQVISGGSWTFKIVPG